MKGRYELMDFLLNKCSNCASMLPNAKNERSETPLHLAAAHHSKGKYLHICKLVYPSTKRDMEFTYLSSTLQ